MKRLYALERAEGVPVSRFTRREFLQRTALTGAALAVAGSGVRAAQAGGSELPTRVLGRTGARVTVLGLGTAPLGEARVEDGVGNVQLSG